MDTVHIEENETRQGLIDTALIIALDALDKRANPEAAELKKKLQDILYRRA